MRTPHVGVVNLAQVQYMGKSLIRRFPNRSLRDEGFQVYQQFMLVGLREMVRCRIGSLSKHTVRSVL